MDKKPNKKKYLDMKRITKPPSTKEILSYYLTNILNGNFISINSAIDHLYNQITTEYEAKELLENTDSYKELETYYERYLTDLCNLFNSLGLNKPLLIAKAYDLLLKPGFFSETKNKINVGYEYDKDSYSSKLYGTRVSTGESNCRHDASLLKDILNHLNYSACNIFTCLANINNLDEVEAINNMNSPNHVVTGIIEDNEIYLYDPINHSSIVLDKNHFNRQDNQIIGKTADETLLYRLINKDILYEYFDFNSIPVDDFLNHNRKIINLEYENYCHDLAMMLLYLNDDILKSFQEGHLDLLHKISSLNKLIAPSSNKKIRSWKVI